MEKSILIITLFFCWTDCSAGDKKAAAFDKRQSLKEELLNGGKQYGGQTIITIPRESDPFCERVIKQGEPETEEPDLSCCQQVALAVLCAFTSFI